MAATAGRHTRARASEEVVAVARVVVAATIGVGAMAAAIGLSTGEPIALIGIPTLILGIAVRRGWIALVGWSSAAIWAFLVPHAREEALVAPIAMLVVSLGIAIGPDRLLAWLGRDVAGARELERGSDEGWIEEDGHPID
jgi:hypothetical protein